MKIVNILGGLGNQMFGYAIAITLKTKFPNTEIKIDTTTFRNYKLHNGFELYEVFNCPKIEFATEKEISKLTWYCRNTTVQKFLRKFMPRRRTECIERPVEKIRPDAFISDRDYYYSGYWQWGGYFEDIKQIIIDCFKFKTDGVLSKKQIQLVKEIEENHSIGVHIRRGDYLKEPLYQGICNIDYYKRAFAIMESKVENPIYYIFSNDLKWCKENIPSLTKHKCIFVENTGKYSYIDMYMMTRCQNLIIANSSFSWWSAYLNIFQKIIVAPNKWINMPIGRKIQENSWILL